MGQNFNNFLGIVVVAVNADLAFVVGNVAEVVVVVVDADDDGVVVSSHLTPPNILFRFENQSDVEQQLEGTERE